MTVDFKRKWLTASVAASLCVSGWSIGNVDRAFADFASEGCGASAADPCIITTVDQLEEMGVPANLGKYFELGADLDLEGVNWDPIGGGGTPEFTGTLDGKGHTIANLTINTGGAGTNDLGLFGETSNATIRNVGLIDVSIQGANGDYVGGLAGYSFRTTFEHVYVTGSLSAGDQVGGVAGYAANGAVRYSYAAVMVTGSSNVGALIGDVDGIVTAPDSYFNATLTSASAAGTGLTTAQMTNGDSFAGWNFAEDGEGNWGIVDGVTYPMHRETFRRVALGTLEVEGGGGSIAFEPAFEADRFEYASTVPNSVDSVDVSTTAEGVVAGDGTGISLAEGVNTIDIEVSSSDVAFPAPSGFTGPLVVEYKLTIAREDGSGAYPHSIATAEQLGAIGTGNFALSDTYRLMNDIDLADYVGAGGGGYHGGDGWDPIGSGVSPFTGEFDGNFHVIDNLSLQRTDEDHVGLFAVLGAGGTVSNLGVTRANVTGNRKVGALAGEIAGGTVEKVYATGSVTGADRTGGLAGEVSAGTVSRAYSAVSVTGDTASGGLIGYGSGGVSDAYWDTEVSGRNASAGGSGAVGKTTSEMRTASTFVGWDVPTVWAMMEGTTYPMFRSGYDAVKLNSLQAEASGDALLLNPGGFASGRGAYTAISDEYITSVEITAAPDDPDTKVVIGGTPAATATIPVAPGDNVIEIRTTEQNGFAQGLYKITVQVPEPVLTLPVHGNYGAGDRLTFTVKYGGDVVVAGVPRIPITIGEGADVQTVYADYIGKSAPDTLNFAYDVQAGLVDTDDIEVGTAVDLPADAGIALAGITVSLGLPAIDAGGIAIDSRAPTIDIAQAPDSGTLTREKVTLTIAADGTGSDVAEVRWADGVRTAAYFDGGGTPLADDAFDVTENGTYSVYAKDAFGNAAVETIHVGNIISELPQLALSYAPTTTTNEPVTVTVTAGVYGAGNALSKLNWMTGSRVAADFAAGASGTDILGARAFQATANGTYTVYARDAAGNEAVYEIAISNIASPPPPSNDSESADREAPAPATIVRAPDGTISIVIHPSGLAKVESEDGRDIESAAMTDALLRQVLDLLGSASRPHVTVIVDDSAQVVQVQFPAASLEAVKEAFPETVFEVRLNGSSFGLPVGLVDVEGWAERLRAEPGPLQVNVELAQAAGQDRERLEQAAAAQGLKPVGPAIEFTLTASAGGTSMEIRDFGGTYVARSIAVDRDIADHRLIAVWYDPDERTFSFVPAILVPGREGRREMSMKSPHNSFYAVMETERKSFADLKGHWAQDDAELLAAKRVVQGVSASRFSPDTPVTRAEFTALLVRALGIGTETGGESPPFRDVSPDDWYASAIAAGVDAGLVDGISSDTFAPNRDITREQMAVMIANALRFAGEAEMEPAQENEVLRAFSDRSTITDWAKSAVAQAAAARIIHGTPEGTMAPSEQATRAQAAVMLIRLLRHLVFID